MINHETHTKNICRVVANESNLVPTTTNIFNGMRKIFIMVACKSSGITALRSPPPHAKLMPTHVSKSKKPPYTNQNSFGFIAGNINDSDENNKT